MFKKWFPKKGLYNGAVVFFDGAHYPAGKNGADTRQRLVWHAADTDPESNAGHYKWAAPTDPTHQALYHENDVELVPGG